MVTSVDTGTAGRDRHLRTADFFDVEKFPELTFKSTKVEKKGKGWMVTGDLKSVELPKPFRSHSTSPAFFRGDQEAAKIGITAETSINRRDYGVNYGTNLPNGTAVLSDDVKVVLSIEAANRARRVRQHQLPSNTV